MSWVNSEIGAAEKKYPTRPIQIVIGFQPGTTDMSLMPLTDKLPEYLGQPVVFVYKPGAHGSVGGSFVAKSKPDGYTLFGTSASALIATPLTMEGCDSSSDDFVPIARCTGTPFLLVVRSDSPFKTLKDIVEEGKKSPGKLTYSSSGAFSNQHMSMETLLNYAGVNITHVPCLGSAPSVTALLGGHVSMNPNSVNTVVPHIKSGAFRIICVFTKERLKEFPDVPTSAESGYPVFFSGWYGLVAPKGTPEEVIKIIIVALNRVVQDHRNFIDDRLRKLMLNLEFVTGEEFGKVIKAENEIYKKVIHELKKTSK